MDATRLVGASFGGDGGGGGGDQYPTGLPTPGTLSISSLVKGLGLLLPFELAQSFATARTPSFGSYFRLIFICPFGALLVLY